MRKAEEFERQEKAGVLSDFGNSQLQEVHSGLDSWSWWRNDIPQPVVGLL
jgi:hypothetical protein